MRTNLHSFQCHTPETPQEALQLKSEVEGIIPIAGGTEVMVWLNDGRMPGKNYQSLHQLARKWRYIELDEDGSLHIGPLTTYTDVRFHPYITEVYPLLVESAKVTGALQIQNRGTLAGNIANGSPAADSVPSLLTYDAKVKLESVRGDRLVELSDFYLGYRKNAMEKDELITEIVLPPQPAPGDFHYFNKVGTRSAQAISKIVFSALRVPGNGHVRISIGSVCPTTIRARKTEEAIAQGAGKEEAWRVLESEIAPIDDVRSTGVYRVKVTRNILWDFLDRTRG